MEKERPKGIRRLYPPWWDHQRHVLTHLRAAVDRALTLYCRPGPGQRVVDLGCGECPYEPLFRRRGTVYIGCDINGDSDVRIEPGSPVPLADGIADGVVSFQVLEHVWDLDWYLGECRRILKPGGWLLLSTHGAWLYHPHPADYRRWTRDGLRRELEQRGLVMEATEGVVGPLAWTTQFRLLGIRHVLQTIPLLGPPLVLMVACLMNLRMAIEDAITPAKIRDDNACMYVIFSRKPLPI